MNADLSLLPEWIFLKHRGWLVVLFTTGLLGAEPELGKSAHIVCPKYHRVLICCDAVMATDQARGWQTPFTVSLAHSIEEVCCEQGKLVIALPACGRRTDVANEEPSIDASGVHNGLMPEKLEEYDIKAKYMRTFLGYIEWPGGIQHDTLVVGVLGRNPFGVLLNDAMHGVLIHGKPILVLVRPVATVAEVLNCNVLFIGDSNQGRAAHVLDVTKGKPIFTISDARGMTVSESMLSFVTESTGKNSRIRFEINLDLATASGIKIGSQMLQSARKIKGHGGSQKTS